MIPIFNLVRGTAGEIAALQVPVITFRHGSGALSTVEVDFVGVAHYADSSFYSALSSTLNQYDHVLFESVMPQESIELELFRDSEIRSTSPGVIPSQQMLFRFLGLSEQVSCLRTAAARFIHADMSSEELDERLKDLGGIAALTAPSGPWEDGDGYCFEAIFEHLSRRWPNFQEFQSAVASGQVFLEARRAYCEWLVSAPPSFAPELREVVFTARETKAIGVLEQLLYEKDLAQPCRIAILFGCGHVNSFATMLQQRLGFVAQENWQWLTAVATDGTQKPGEGHFQTAVTLLQFGE